MPVVVRTDRNVEDLVESGLDGDVEQVNYDEVGGEHKNNPVEASELDNQQKPVVDIDTSPDRPKRTRKANVKYSSTEYDLSLVRQRSRRQIRRAS